MKAIITQRFEIDGCEVDAEADCRFCFLWEKGTEQVTDIAEGEWRARFVRHWYEKDILKPVNPSKVPKLDQKDLDKFPPGYRWVEMLSLSSSKFLYLSLKREVWIFVLNKKASESSE